MTLEDIKIYLKIEEEDTEEDNLLSSFLSAAKSYLYTATSIDETIYVMLEDYDKELYNLALKLLVGEWYSNRSVNIIGKNNSQLSFSLEAILLTLESKYWKLKNDLNDTPSEVIK